MTDSTNVELDEDIDTSNFEHSLTTKVKVHEVYNQVYDKDQDVFFVGESDFENIDDPEQLHECSCGDSFDSRDKAYEHLRENNN